MINTGEGYKADFLTGAEYQNHHLRSVIGSLVKAGVIPDTLYSCKVSVINNNVLIAGGTVIFEDGAVFKTHGLTLQGLGKYVYFSSGYDRIYATVGDTIPENALLLAEIDKDKVTDRRTFAHMRIGVI